MGFVTFYERCKLTNVLATFNALLMNTRSMDVAIKRTARSLLDTNGLYLIILYCTTSATNTLCKIKIKVIYPSVD